MIATIGVVRLVKGANLRPLAIQHLAAVAEVRRPVPSRWADDFVRDVRMPV